MRVAELFEPRRFRLLEQPPPLPGPGQVQARVQAVGVCGSDLHYFSEGGVGDTPCVYPMVLGHEPAGVVTALGPGVSGWSVGDRVALEPAIYCYHCEYCLSGRHNVCARLRFMSTPGDPGFFRDYVTLPAENLLPLPPELSPAEATLFEPLAVVLHSMAFVSPRLGERVAVFGAGPIGLLTVAVLKLAGVGRVWAIEPVAHRRELARRLGADAALDPAAEDPVGRLLADTGGRGVDVAVDCAAQGPSMNQALAVTRYAGRVVITGIPTQAQTALDFHVMRRKELALYNVRRSNRESETALELLRERRRLFAPIVSHELPLEEIQRGFAMLERYADGVGKLVFRLD
jgi:L-iditol 2-dehydrogenase